MSLEKKRERICQQYNLEEVQTIFDREKNLKEFNKIMEAITEKQEVLPNTNEETNNAHLEHVLFFGT